MVRLQLSSRSEICKPALLEQVYHWIEQVLCQQYQQHGRQARGLVRRYLAKMTGLSRAQVTRLIGRYRQSGSIAVFCVAPCRTLFFAPCLALLCLLPLRAHKAQRNDGSASKNDPNTEAKVKRTVGEVKPPRRDEVRSVRPRGGDDSALKMYTLR